MKTLNRWQIVCRAGLLMAGLLLLVAESSAQDRGAALVKDTQAWLDRTVEAARRFAEKSTAPLSTATVEPIARLSMSLEDDIGAARPALLIRDTDLLSTVVYARHYYGASSPWIEAEALRRRADLYLLCHPDLPWTPDGVRDRPTQREALLTDFRAALGALGASVVEVSGVGETRTALAVAAVNALLNQRR